MALCEMDENEVDYWYLYITDLHGEWDINWFDSVVIFNDIGQNN